MPIPNSMLFVRDGRDFGRMALHSSYFNRAESDVPNPGLKSAPTTRPMSALALAASIRHLGLRGLVERLRAPLAAIRSLAEAMAGMDDAEVLHAPDTGVLCFRIIPPGAAADRLDALQLAIHDRILFDGRRTIATTVVRGHRALRLVAVSPAVTTDALLETVVEARRLGRSISG
jgi:glutamate/tyrosine decarboxylase-like PLP-dependent enzyme